MKNQLKTHIRILVRVTHVVTRVSQIYTKVRFGGLEVATVNLLSPSLFPRMDNAFATFE